MFVYHFTAKGVTLPSVIVVVDSSREGAQERADEFLRGNKIDATAELRCRLPFEPPCVVYAWDGDY